MSVFNFTQSSSSPLPSDSNSSLSNTIFSENSPPLLIIAAFLGIGLIGGTILACYSWRRMRTRMLPPGSRSLQYDHRLDLGEMGATKSTSSGDRPQLWDLWTEKDRERDRYASGDDNWDRVLVCLSVRCGLVPLLKKSTHDGSLCQLYQNTIQHLIPTNVTIRMT